MVAHVHIRHFRSLDFRTRRALRELAEIAIEALSKPDEVAPPVRPQQQTKATVAVALKPADDPVKLPSREDIAARRRRLGVL